MKYLLLYILLLPWPFTAIQAQPPRQFAFTHYGTSAGLLSNEVNTVLQDRDGFIWIATNNGLQRFDGARYLTFRHDKNNPRSIPNNTIHQLIRDHEGNLWLILADNRIGYYNTRHFTFTEVALKLSNPNSIYSAKKLVLDEFGNVFMTIMNSEILTWDEQSNELSSSHNFFSLPSDWKSIDMVHQPGTKRYWFGTDHGLTVWDNDTKHLSYEGHNIDNIPAIEAFKGIPMPGNLFFDKQNRIWFDNWGPPDSPHMNCFDVSNNRLVLKAYSLYGSIGTYYELEGYIQQKDGSIWMKGLGVFGQFMEKSRSVQLVYNGYVNEQSIVYERVTSVCEDKEENLWVGTSNNGLYRFSPAEQYFTNVSHFNPGTNLRGKGSVMSFQYCNNNTILAGTWRDGLFRYDNNFNLLPIAIKGMTDSSSPTVWNMTASGDSNTIWMGSQPGIWEYNQATGSAKYYNPPQLENKTIRQIEEDKLGNLWLGTQSIGLFKWSRSSGKKRFEDGISSFDGVPQRAQILEIYEDREGMVWVSTSVDGVYVIDPTTDKVVMTLNSKSDADKAIPAAGIASILDYSDSIVLLAGGTGINFFNRYTKAVRTIGSPEFLNGVICSVEKDPGSEYLWVAMSHGIHRVNPRNQIFVHFDRVDGITDDRFQVASSITLPDGRMMFGADNQFTVFNPVAVQINSSTPPVTITDLKVMNKSLLVDSLMKLDKLLLGHEENSVTIEFSGLSYSGAYIIRYKLEGLDNNWKVADKSNQAIYSYLPPGSYTFIAQSEDAEGKVSSRQTRLLIEVSPPFWRTWWFYGLLVLLGAGILYWIDRQRIRRLTDLQRVRSEIATNLHEDVTTTLSNINLLGEMAKIKADKDIDRSKEYIDQISSQSHNMIIAMDDILWSVDPDNDSMEKTLLRMMEFTDSMKNRHGAAIELSLDKHIRSLKLDMKTRHEFFFIFKEGLRMIVQYAGGRNTQVNIDLFKNRLSMKLQDATAGLDMNIVEIEKIIKEINNRASMLKAELDIQYDKNGIAIVLLIPVK